MYQVGLTGGIASGKSTVSALLAAHGAVIVDADRIAREVVEPGTDALAAIVARFGEGVLQGDGTLDREKLGAIVFADADANRDLRAITHPAIGREIAARIAAEAETDHVVVLDAALLVESGWSGFGKLIVVAADREVQRERLMRDRGMTAAEADARISMQAPLADKIARADIVITNNGSLDDLERRVDAVWAELCAQREAARAVS